MPWMPATIVASRMPNEEWDDVLAIAQRAVASVAGGSAPDDVSTLQGGLSCST
jgi:hypothetical protein